MELLLINATKDRKKEKLWWDAVWKGNNDSIRKGIESGVDLNKLIPFSENNNQLAAPLQIVCETGYAESVVEMIDAKADINNWVTLATLLDEEQYRWYVQPANINRPYFLTVTETVTPLQYMCRYGQEAPVIELIKHKADVNYGIQYTPLEEACSTIFINFNIIRVLIEANADTNQFKSKPALCHLFSRVYLSRQQIMATELLMKHSTAWLLYQENIWQYFFGNECTEPLRLCVNQRV